MGKLTNKVAVVTGASKGIGAAIARHLAAEGATVVVNYATSQEGAERVVGEIERAGGKAIAVGADLTRSEEVDRLFAITKERLGHVDILVNNAGLYTFFPLDEITPELYERVYGTNVLGLLLATRAAVRLMPATGGSVINVSSAASALAPPMASLYASSKAAVDVITRSLAKELGPRNIRVNAVSPGLVATEGYHSGGFTTSDLEKNGVAMTPLGRVGQPDDIAAPVVFLASDEARWITGDILFVSGGAGA